MATATHGCLDKAAESAKAPVGQDREVDLHQVPDQSDAHVAVDARAGVLDQVPPKHVHRLTHQVGQTDHRQIAGGDPHQSLWRKARVAGRIHRVDQPAQVNGNRRAGRAGQAHDQEGPAQGTPMAPGD
jgi:hypothetical protein